MTTTITTTRPRSTRHARERAAERYDVKLQLHVSQYVLARVRDGERVGCRPLCRPVGRRQCWAVWVPWLSQWLAVSVDVAQRLIITTRPAASMDEHRSLLARDEERMRREETPKLPTP